MAAAYPLAFTNNSNSKTNFIRCHEAIQLICSLSMPLVRLSIEQWHQMMQTHLQNCTTPHCPAKGKPNAKRGSCPSCVQWGVALQNTHSPSQNLVNPQWPNVNPTLLHKDPVEVAKAFVLRLPKGHICRSFGDFDVASILMMMVHFKGFHRGIKQHREHIEKVCIYVTCVEHACMASTKERTTARTLTLFERSQIFFQQSIILKCQSDAILNHSPHNFP